MWQVQELADVSNYINIYIIMYIVTIPDIFESIHAN